jgi:Domain of unknown function (DUF4383)
MKIAALVAGIFFLLLGIAGFVPSLSTDGQIFGIFPAETVFIAIYIVAGAFGIMTGLSHQRALELPRGPGNDLRDLHA